MDAPMLRCLSVSDPMLRSSVPHAICLGMQYEMLDINVLQLFIYSIYF
jgi:hypothetical protein